MFMNRHRIFIALILSFLVSDGRAEPPSASTGTVPNQRPEEGLRAMKKNARRDPSAIAIDLTSPEAEDRGHAAEMLGRLGTNAQSATDALLETLTDFATYREDGNLHIVSAEAALALRHVNPDIRLSSKILNRLVRVAGADPDHVPVKG